MHTNVTYLLFIKENDAIKQMEAKGAQFKMRIQGHASVVHLDFLS